MTKVKKKEIPNLKVKISSYLEAKIMQNMKMSHFLYPMAFLHRNKSGETFLKFSTYNCFTRKLISWLFAFSAAGNSSSQLKMILEMNRDDTRRQQRMENFHSFEIAQQNKFYDEVKLNYLDCLFCSMCIRYCTSDNFRKICNSQQAFLST